MATDLTDMTRTLLCFGDSNTHGTPPITLPRVPARHDSATRWPGVTLEALGPGWSLVEEGLPPQNAYLEVAYQIDLIVSLVKQHGIDGMLERISAMARYGSVVNGPRVLTGDVKKNMKHILKEITSGRFVAKMDRTGLKYSASQYEKVANAEFDKQARKFSRK